MSSGFVDPRGPRRTIVTAESTPEHWLLTLDCGHVSHGTSHFWFEVGTTHHCLQCRKEGRS